MRYDPESLITGRAKESTEANRYIMPAAKGSYKHKVQWQPVKKISGDAYMRMKKNET